MQRELLLLREMRVAASAIRSMVDGRSADEVEAATEDLPTMIAGLEAAISGFE